MPVRRQDRPESATPVDRRALLQLTEGRTLGGIRFPPGGSGGRVPTGRSELPAASSFGLFFIQPGMPWTVPFGHPLLYFGQGDARPARRARPCATCRSRPSAPLHGKVIDRRHRRGHVTSQGRRRPSSRPTPCPGAAPPRSLRFASTPNERPAAPASRTRRQPRL